MASILVVEDSQTQMETMKRTIETMGHEVIWAKNGEEAVEMASEHQPKLILMDILMPGENGFQATRKISKDLKTSNIPIIIISTKSSESDKIWGLRQGAKEYLTKPFSKNELKDIINKFLN